MEALRTEYASDSSSDDEFESENVQKNMISKTSSDGNKAVSSTVDDSFGDNDIDSGKVEKKGCKEINDDLDNTKTDHQDSSQKTETFKEDYFGLSKDDSKSECTETGSSNQSRANKIENVHIHEEGKSVSVEIPSSNFWKELKSSELQSLQDNVIKSKAVGYFRETSKHNLNKRQKFVANSDQESFYSRSQNFEARLSQKQDSYGNQQNQSYGSTEKMADNQQSQSRKLVFVHPKIAPLLHSHRQTCRAPSKLEWKSQCHGGAVNRVKWNISQYSHLFVTCSMDSIIKIWNIWSQLDPCVKVLSNHTKAVRDVDWNQDGKRLLSCSYDKTSAVLDVEKGCPVCVLNHTCYVSCGKWQPTNANMCVTGGQNLLQAWDIRTPDVPVRQYQYKDDFGQVQDILFSEDGSTFFSSNDLVSRDLADRNLMAWDFNTGVTLSNQIYQERYTISRLKLHPSDGNFLAQSNGNYIAVFSGTRPYKMNKGKRFEGHKLLGYSLGFDITPDGSSVISGSSDGKLYYYNYQTGKMFRALQTEMDVIMDVSFHPLLGSTLACCAWDGSVQVWK